MSTYWRDEAACLPDPGGGDRVDGEIGHTALPRYTAFIEKYCYRCPVAQQCLDTSVGVDGDGSEYDDARETVRGGYLPTVVSVARKGKRSKDPWQPKRPPNPLPFNLRDRTVSMLVKGACFRGRHGILGEEDMKRRSDGNWECKACRRGHRWEPEESDSAKMMA